MFTYNVVVNEGTKERAYYINNVRFDRVHFRKSIELEITQTKIALEFQQAQINALQYSLKSAQQIKDGNASFELPEGYAQIYRQVCREIREELAEAKQVFEHGQIALEELIERLED